MPIELSNDEKDKLIAIARTAAQKMAELWDLADDLGAKYGACFNGTESLVPQWAGWLDFPADGNALNADDLLAMFLALPQRQENQPAGFIRMKDSEEPPNQGEG